LPPGAELTYFGSDSGPLPFYQRLEEILLKKVMVASIHIRKYSSQRW